MKAHPAIQTLQREHEMILQVVAGIGNCGQKLQDGVGIDADQLHEGAAFLMDFVERRHHAKEKDLLYLACVDYGLQLYGHPMAALMQERHEALRLGDLFASSLSAYEDRLPGAALRLASAIDRLSGLYPGHIREEEESVFPIITRVLPSEALNRLHGQFVDIDARSSPDGDRRYRDLAARLGTTAM
jgi:hemerythrin-like domain-containing protein